MFKNVLLALLAFIINVPAAFSADDRLEICKVDGEYTIKLPSAMREALKEYDWQFVVSKQNDYLPDILTTYRFTDKQTPFAVIGDFNGDNVLDVVLQGHDRKYNQVLGIISSGKGYEVVPVLSYPWVDPMDRPHYRGESSQSEYLTYVHPHCVESAFEGFPLELKTDAFEMEYFKKASILYYYENGVFDQYTTGE